MIDTDKYTGHTEGPWELIPNYEEGWDNTWEGNVHLFTTLGIGIDKKSLSVTDAQLMADAPLLLAEVKELRRQIKVAQGVFEYLYHFHGADKSEDAHWIRWFCNMESEEE